jgi:hypothetical protein
MSETVAPLITAVAVHRKASSACCAAPLALAPEDAPHEHDCTQCGQPAARVLGEPRYIPASGALAALPEDGAR